MSFLLLKPEHACQQAVEEFRQAGLDCLGLSLIRISHINEGVIDFSKQLASTNADAILIFVSKSAVSAVSEVLQAASMSHPVFAIGKSTQSSLHSLGIDALCATPETSEGLFNFIEQQQKQYKQVLLVKGVGGRDYLERQFSKKGIRTSVCEVYQREPIEQPAGLETLDMKNVKSIIATSAEQLQLAFACMKKSDLTGKTWIVVSKRMADIANEYGIGDILLSDGAQTDALITTAKQFLGATNV